MKITSVNHLFRCYFIEKNRKLLKAVIILFSLATLASIIEWLDISSPVIFLALIVLASMFFQPYFKKTNLPHYFNLPVTSGEKLFHAIFTLLILFFAFKIIMIFGTFIGYYLLRPVFYTAGNTLFFDAIQILKLNIWSLEKYLLFAGMVSIFLFGSIYFKKNAIFKTLLLICGFLFCCLIILFLVFLILNVNSNGNLYFRNYDNPTNVNIVDYWFIQDYYCFIYAGLTPVFLALTYLRLKETEV